ncbi:hypothetical protein K5V07_12250 [Flavobacterium sp. CHNK8]|uniref:hypothetical protein n=1 Tax=Flavobacterium sp. CHNK8 TaxID=2871165 RepID=UPI001C8D1C3D|nr:hypothetical protein [Flavobacterium sp. CHNK8]QZK91219.1 hypothetical protein K5V07_12250 [Flavobacterium sp. CHNK8]
MGLVNALCWSALWPMALQDMGGYIRIDKALLIMEIIGGAIFRLVYGYLAETINFANEVMVLQKKQKVAIKLHI